MGRTLSTDELPLYERIKEEISQKLSMGLVKPDDRLPSDGQIASQYGVSRMTAREALAQLAGEGFILKVPGKGSFVAGKIRESEHAGIFGGKVLTFIAPYGTEAFKCAVAEAVIKTVQELGYEVVHCSYKDPIDEANQLRKVLTSGVKGLIYWPWVSSTANISVLSEIKKAVPVAIVNNVVPGFEADAIISDDKQGAYLITTHLIELGYNRILHLAGKQGDSTAEDRIAGYRTALEDYGIEYDPRLVRYTSWDAVDGYCETKKVWVNYPPDIRPNAVFACADHVAAGAVSAFKELGIRVPDDVAVAGYSNIPLASALETPLTTVDQDAVEMGRTAAQLVVEKLRGYRDRDDVRIVVISTKLVVRRSCGIRRLTVAPDANIACLRDQGS